MNFDKKNIKIILGIITFTILLAALCIKFSSFLSLISSGISLLMPFILGGAIAFILNVFMGFFEDKLFKRVRFKKLKRITSVILTLLSVVLVLTIVIRIVVPEIINSVTQLVKEAPDKIEQIANWIGIDTNTSDAITDYIDSLSDTAMNKISSLKDGNFDEITSLFGSVGNVVSSAFGIATKTISGITSFLIGVVFAIYILVQKERLGKQARQLLYAFVPEKKADIVARIFSVANRTFRNFISGQCTESLILGTMFFISMLIFQMPYALMISILIALTSLIPIIGAFIGCAVGAVLIFIDSPKKAIIFIIMFLVIQQIEGNLIYPHVVGNSIGLPSMWVLFAVTVGGSMFGVVGILLFIPLSSVVYELLREYVILRLRAKRVPRSKYIIPEPETVPRKKKEKEKQEIKSKKEDKK